MVHIIGRDIFGKTIKFNVIEDNAKLVCVEIWLMIMPNKHLSHIIIEKFYSKHYIDLLRTSAVPTSKLNYGDDFFLQEDHCSMQVEDISQFHENESDKILK